MPKRFLFPILVLVLLLIVMVMTIFQVLGIQEFLESKDWLFVTLTAIIFILSTTVYYIYRLNCRLVKNLNESRRRHSQEKLSQREEQLLAITNNVNTVMFLKDLDGRYLYVNQEYEKSFNVSNAEIQGKTDYDIFPDDLADTFTKNDKTVIWGKQSIEVEAQVLHMDGLLHSYIVIKTPIWNKSGKIYAVAGIAMDITERKNNEDMLFLAKKRAELTLMEQRQFIAMVSHDYRSPLAVIDAAAELLAAKIPKESDDLNIVITRIRRGVSLLSNTIDNCMAEDRLEDCETLKLHNYPINLNELAASVIEYANQISQHDITLDIPSNFPLLNGDEKLLSILLLNLLNNAIKYSPQNSKIELRIKEKGTNCSFEVIDFGIGIPADERHLIFKKYFRGRLTAAISGTGLGLSLVLRIANLHGGNAEMKSTLGKGSHITVTIPFNPTNPPD